MRAVVDTNVLISGLFWRGTPHRLLQEVRAGRLAVVTSPALLAELQEVLRRPKFRAILAASHTDADSVLREVQRMAEIVDPVPLPVPASRDPDDDAVLAAAIAARVDLIVSGDADLLVLGVQAGIAIRAPAEALAAVMA